MKLKLLFVSVIILAFILRVYNLGKTPSTLYGDEQAFAWNAFNILKLGQDEYGTPYPLQFRSFGDYKAPIPVYLLVPFIKLFGLNSFAIRLPIAIASTLTVIVSYYLACLFLNKKASLVAILLMAISPWHIHLSRGFFEAALSLLFYVTAIYFFLKSQDKTRHIFISVLFFVLTIYSYFSPRILLPVILPFLFLYIFRFQKDKKINLNIKYYLTGLILLLILCLPLLHFTFFGKGLSRFNNLTASNQKMIIESVNNERFGSNLSPWWREKMHNKVTSWVRIIKNNYLENLSLNFWYISGDSSLRYFLGNTGMFHLFELPFLILGLYFLHKEKRAAFIFFLGWIMLAPVPTSLVGRPFAVRSLAMLPAPFIFVAYGIYKVTTLLNNQYKKWITLFTLTFICIFTLDFYLIRYYLEYPKYAATWWGWENKTVLDYAKKNEDKYDYIFISDFYSGSLLAYSVYNSLDPIEYRYAISNPVSLADGRSFFRVGKYYFGSLDIDEKRKQINLIPPRSLYFARPEEANSGETINAPDDDRIIFKIYRTD